MCHCIPHFKPNYTIIIQIDLTNQCLRLTEYPHEDKEGHGEERGAREEDGGETEGRAGGKFKIMIVKVFIILQFTKGRSGRKFFFSTILQFSGEKVVEERV